MKFMQLLRILRAHTGLIALTISLAWLLAAVITVITTPRYVATSSALIDSADPMANTSTPAPNLPHSSFVATQADLAASQTVALKVVDRLNLVADSKARDRYLGSESSVQETLSRGKAFVASLYQRLVGAKTEPEIDPTESNERLRLADRLLSKASIRPSPDSNVLHVTFTASSAKAAADGANAIIKAYIDTTLELNVNPARATSVWLDSQVQRLAEVAKEARANYTNFQQRTGIVAEGGADDSARLTDLTSQLVAAQAQNHPAIQALKSDLARAQAKLSDLPPQLGPNHPTYQRAKNEVTALQASLAQESAQLASGLRQAVGQQKASILQLQRQHGELAALKDAVDTAQKALDDATQRATQASMNSQVTQTNVSIVRTAVPPRQPTTPNPFFNFSLATVCGLILGIGLALWREVVCRFVRSADDLRDFLGVQVLGVLHGGPRSSSGRARLASTMQDRLAHERPMLATQANYQANFR